jgi:hypothetical protein
VRTARAGMLGIALIAVALAGCSSSGHGASPATSSTSGVSSTTAPTVPPAITTAPGDPDELVNPIPYNVGEKVGLPGDWTMQVAKVQRPFTAAGLPAPPSGEDYVAVDIALNYDGDAPVVVNARKILTIVDAAAGHHDPVSGTSGVSGLDATYTAGAHHSGRAVFAVPVGKNLQLLLDGPAIHTQRSVFQIDPPRIKPID